LNVGHSPSALSHSTARTVHDSAMAGKKTGHRARSSLTDAAALQPAKL
jgi:hypothetical protein